MAKTELFGTAGCPYTSEMREWLEWQNREFDEYDVELDRDALTRMLTATGGQRTVPVLIENGTATHIGWQGRGCIVAKGA
jgi:mycoredoxin